MFSPFVCSSTPFIPCRPPANFGCGHGSDRSPGVWCNTTEKFRAELLYRKYAHFASIFFAFFTFFPIFFAETGYSCWKEKKTQYVDKFLQKHVIPRLALQVVGIRSLFIGVTDCHVASLLAMTRFFVQNINLGLPRRTRQLSGSASTSTISGPMRQILHQGIT